MTGRERAVVWVGSSLEELRRFPAPARRAAGHQLHRIQLGLEPSDWRPMAGLGPGVREIRIHSGGAFRVVYLTGGSGAVYVIHAFEKKSRRTPPMVIELIHARLSALRRHHPGG